MSGFVRISGGDNGGGSGMSGAPFVYAMNLLSYHYGTDNDLWLNSDNNISFQVKYTGTDRGNEDQEGLAMPVIGLDYLKKYNISFNYSADVGYSGSSSSSIGAGIFRKLGNIRATKNKNTFEIAGNKNEKLYQSGITWYEWQANQRYSFNFDFGFCENMAILSFDLSQPNKTVTHTIRDIKITELPSTILYIPPFSLYNNSATDKKTRIILKYSKTGQNKQFPLKIHITGKCAHGKFLAYQQVSAGVVIKNDLAYANTETIDDYLYSFSNGTTGDSIDRDYYFAYIPDDENVYTDDYITVNASAGFTSDITQGTFTVVEEDFTPNQIHYPSY